MSPISQTDGLDNFVFFFVLACKWYIIDVYVFLSGRRAHYVGQYNCIIAAAADNMCVSILGNVCKLVYRRCQDCAPCRADAYRAEYLSKH